MAPAVNSPDATKTTPRQVAGIELVLFDYGQVLSMPPDPIAWQRIQTITGLDDATLHEAYWQFRHDYDRDALNGLAYWNEVARFGGVRFHAEQVRALFVADVDLWTRPNPPMIEWAKQLQQAGMRTAILSNIGDAMAEGVSSRLDWLKGFERCVWSYALRMAKPETQIFLTTAQQLQLTPERVLFIDDKEENVAAARAVGMRSIQYASQGKFETEMHEQGFASLLQLGRTTGTPG